MHCCFFVFVLHIICNIKKKRNSFFLIAITRLISMYVDRSCPGDDDSTQFAPPKLGGKGMKRCEFFKTYIYTPDKALYARAKDLHHKLSCCYCLALHLYFIQSSLSNSQSGLFLPSFLPF